VLDVADVLGERVGVDDVWRLDTVQDHVHNADHVGEALFFLAEECLLLKRSEILGRQAAALMGEILERLAQEASRAAGAVINALANFRLYYLDHGADQRTRRVVLAAIST